MDFALIIDYLNIFNIGVILCMSLNYKNKHNSLNKTNIQTLPKTEA